MQPAPYVVYPTQAWQVVESEASLTGTIGPAAQGAAPLGDYVYLFAQTPSDEQMYLQRVLIETSSNPSAPWGTFLQGVPTPISDPGGPLGSQAPPAAVAAHGLIYLFFTGSDDDNRIYTCRYNGTSWAPFEMVQMASGAAIGEAIPGLPPFVATLDQTIFLGWPGIGQNGYFYSIGTFGPNDSFGPTVSWSDPLPIPGTETWVHYGDNESPSVSALKTDLRSGFLFFTRYFDGSNGGSAYLVYDNAKGQFTTDTALGVTLLGGPTGSALGCTFTVNDSLTVPLLIDAAGNITSYQLNDDDPNFGSFSDWLQCAVGGPGGGIGVSVGIPPSISISGDVDTSPTPLFSGMTIYPGTNGGALVCGQLDDPIVGSNSLGYAVIPLNFRYLNGDS